MLRYFVGTEVSERSGIIYAEKRRHIPHLKRPFKSLAVSLVLRSLRIIQVNFVGVMWRFVMLMEAVLQKINRFLDGTKGRTDQPLRLVTDSCVTRLQNDDTGELTYRVRIKSSLITNIYYTKTTVRGIQTFFFSKCNSRSFFLQHTSTLQHVLLLLHGERLIDNQFLSTCSPTCLQLL